MRYDWVLPIGLCALPWLAHWSWRTRLRAAIGFSAFAAVYAPYIAVVGVGNVWVSAKLLRIAQSARTLPLPIPPTPAGWLFALMLVSIVLLVVLGLRRRHTNEGRIFLSVALLAVGLIPYALSRADLTHIRVGATAPIVLLVAALPALYKELRPFVRAALAKAAVACIALAALVMFLGAMPQTPGKADAVSYGGRSFPIGNARTAANAQRAIALADRLAPRNGRLFVGPADLRRTVYADSYIYYLLPHLQPATFFIILDPGITSIQPHRLAIELENADVLILNRAYDAVSEHNRSRIFGSPAPNQTVARDFCRRGRFGSFLVYTSCSGIRAVGTPGRVARLARTNFTAPSRLPPRACHDGCRREPFFEGHDRRLY